MTDMLEGLSRSTGESCDAGMPLLQASHVSKRFPGVLALNDVSVSVRAGEIVALMGENGAGKSTLIKVLGGAQRPDRGELSVDGVPVPLGSIGDAKARGIILIHQELMLSPNLDVASNIFLGGERRRDRLGTLDRRWMYAEADRLIRRVGLNISPRALAGSLTTGQMQMVEICKALSQNVRVLVLDEPTSSLSVGETERLLKIMFELRARGVGMLYVSHRMEEVFRVADRIAVLRDGVAVGELTRERATPEKLVTMMVGRQVSSVFSRRRVSGAERMLEVNGLVVPGASAPVSFHACRGEVVGFAGLIGSGRTELMQVLAGVMRAHGGRVSIEGRVHRPKNVRDAVRRGVCLVPEDRKAHGLILSLTIAQNISLPNLRRFQPRGYLDSRGERQSAEVAISHFQIRPGKATARALHLSGGNQQKVVLAKWLAMRPRLLILDEPTRGIDVGARAEFYERIVALADQGLTILLVSSDLEEVLSLSDRIIVMRNRKIAGVLSGDQMTRERAGLLMTSEGAAA
jgi:ribose transport system ATP-binding protein